MSYFAQAMKPHLLLQLQLESPPGYTYNNPLLLSNVYLVSAQIKMLN